ncbi:MAG: signal peptidase I [Candidatus Lokiarchaeota archaeon]|nr:signal peptidase I [Candidatus Lokiarchaeota archaeon]
MAIPTEKGKKQLVVTIIVVVAIFGGTYSTYLVLQASFHTPIPIVVVTSGSMEPTIYRGDVLFVKNVPPEEIVAGSHLERTGDVIIYETRGLWASPISEPVVHRVVNKTFTAGKWYFTTQGDNVITNSNPDLYLVPEDKVYGKVVGIIPQIGQVKLFLDDTGLAIPLLAFLALLLVISIIWDYTHPEKKETKQDGTEDPGVSNPGEPLAPAPAPA